MNSLFLTLHYLRLSGRDQYRELKDTERRELAELLSEWSSLIVEIDDEMTDGEADAENAAKRSRLAARLAAGVATLEDVYDGAGGFATARLDVLLPNEPDWDLPVLDLLNQLDPDKRDEAARLIAAL